MQRDCAADDHAVAQRADRHGRQRAARPRRRVCSHPQRRGGRAAAQGDLALSKPCPQAAFGCDETSAGPAVNPMYEDVAEHGLHPMESRRGCRALTCAACARQRALDTLQRPRARACRRARARPRRAAPRAACPRGTRARRRRPWPARSRSPARPPRRRRLPPRWRRAGSVWRAAPTCRGAAQARRPQGCTACVEVAGGAGLTRG